MSNKTNDAITTIVNTYKSIKRPKSDANDQEILNIVEENIAKYLMLKTEYNKLYLSNTAALLKYSEKLKNVKIAYSKEYFNKKIGKHREACLQLLGKMTSTDETIDSLKNIKSKLLVKIWASSDTVVENVNS